MKKLVDGLFSKQCTEEQIMSSAKGNASGPVTQPRSLAGLKEGFYGLPGSDPLGVLEEGGSVLLPNGNSICLKRPAPIPCKQALPLQP